jgi:hypothetical protein
MYSALASGCVSFTVVGKASRLGPSQREEDKVGGEVTQQHRKALKLMYDMNVCTQAYVLMYAQSAPPCLARAVAPWRHGCQRQLRQVALGAEFCLGLLRAFAFAPS